MTKIEDYLDYSKEGRRDTVFKIEIGNNEIYSEGRIPKADFNAIIEIVNCLDTFRKKMIQHIDGFLDWIEKEYSSTSPDSTPPPEYQKLLATRKRNRKILNIINKIRDMEGGEKEQLLKDMEGIITKGM
jgi:hypothetical protein